jgi:uncharacterized membrane protein YfcA
VDPFAQPWLIPFLFATGLFAGLVDSIAGGGGLITVPVLLGIGLPPQLALGTNKFQACFGSFTASLNYVRRGGVSLKECRAGIFFTFVGAALGTVTVQVIAGEILSKVIPFLLLAIIVYSIVSPKIGEEDIRSRMRPLPFYALFGLALGFYDGFFGPGTGSFWTVAFLLGLGFNLAKAAGFTKVMNFTSNIVSFALFLAGGHVSFALGAAMAVGEIAGARLGSSLVIAKGARFVRPVFIGVVVLTTVKLFYDWWFRV